MKKDTKKPRPKKLKMIADDKQRGEWAELRFMACAAEHGLKINKPWGDSAPYDFVVGSGGNLARVQVKSTCHHHANGYGLTIKAAKLYAADAFDFLAAYVIPEDTWYIIPEPLVRGHAAMYLQPGREQARYASYQEAWQLLRKATGVKEMQEQSMEPSPEQSTEQSPEQPPAEENAQLVSPSMQRAFDYMSKGMLRIRDNRIAMFRAMHPPAEKTEE
ncbi:MAG: group I intron-associated PD-(D/E)XK endonuclease [Terriglobales bacterium]|jgi:hypothetical protein